MVGFTAGRNFLLYHRRSCGSVVAAALARAALAALAVSSAVSASACGRGVDSDTSSGGFFRQYRVRGRGVPVARGHGDGLRQRVAGGAERAARHVVRHRPERPARSSGGARLFSTPVTRVRRRGQRVAPQQPPVRPREARRRRHPPARRGGAVRVVDVRVQT